MRDHNFPRDMRSLSPIAEHDQMAAFTTLRLSVLQVSTSCLAYSCSVVWVLTTLPTECERKKNLNLNVIRLAWALPLFLHSHCLAQLRAAFLRISLFSRSFHLIVRLVSYISCAVHHAYSEKLPDKLRMPKVFAHQTSENRAKFRLAAAGQPGASIFEVTRAFCGLSCKRVAKWPFCRACYYRTQ